MTEQRRLSRKSDIAPTAPQEERLFPVLALNDGTHFGLVADCRFRGATDMRPLKRADRIDANDPEQKRFENICSPHCVPTLLHGLTS